MTQQEPKEKRVKGLCFSCDEKYTPGHKYKNQKLFRLEKEPEDEEEMELGIEDEGGTLELRAIKLSLNSITGVNSIRLLGKINGREVGFLIDTGATHNFIDLMMVEKSQLRELSVDSFEVKVVRGAKMAGVHCCRGVKMNIQGQDSETDFLVIPLGDAQIILGTVGLRS